MSQLVRVTLALIGMAVAGVAAAVSPVWSIEQIYTNADGSVQFAVYATDQPGQQYLAGQTLVARPKLRSWSSRNDPAYAARTFTLPGDLPGDSANRRFVVATQGFANLNVLAPDYVVPNGFFPMQGGSVSLAGNAAAMFPAPPTDGLHSLHNSALDAGGVEWVIGFAAATNFAGEQYAFPQPPAPPDDWMLMEVFSNFDGTVQFAVFTTNRTDQQHLAGHTLVAANTAGAAKSFTFPNDLPDVGDSSTGHIHMLVSTQGFADLNVVAPDYVVPNGFFPFGGGTITVAGFASAYDGVPTNGVDALWIDTDFYGWFSWYDTAVAVNYAGGEYVFDSTTLPPPPPPPPRPCRRWLQC